MTSEPKNPRGFEGLNSLVSDVVIAEKKPAVEGKAAGTSPLPEMDLSSPVPAVKTYSTGYYGLALVGVATLIFALIQTSLPTAPVSQAVGAPTQSAPYEPPLPKPVEVIERTFYVIQGSDGSRLEIEGPDNATAEQLNALGQSELGCSQEIPDEERPPVASVGQGNLLEDSQIRYCLSQKIRLEVWQLTVDGTDHDSVATFNTEVEDYNARCERFQYRTGALERVRAQIEMRREQLGEEGRLHLGPQQSAKLPTFKLVSSRKQFVDTELPHARCAGSLERTKCELQESQLDRETPGQRRARQQRNEVDRLNARSEVNSN